ncbi:MAG: glycosyltransferase [Bacteroidota bacterium]|nr:glycosyltransferase [Bacteroidota bacterium]
MEYPKITIITPVYNQVEFIERTIRSVLEQNYPNLEYIIVDGGSTDGTKAIIEKYRTQINMIISEKDDGMYHALDKGFRNSTGELMAWINADDRYHYNSFFIVAEIFSKYKNVEFLMGQPSTFDEQDRCVMIGELRQWSKYDFFISGTNWGIQQESTFWRRSLWERSGSYISTDYKLAGDCELWTRFLVGSNAKLHMTTALIGGFRTRANQLSSNRSAYANEVKRIVEVTEKSTAEIATLKKIDLYKKYLSKFPVLRVLLNWNQNYRDHFDYPPVIRYDLKKRGF